MWLVPSVFRAFVWILVSLWVLWLLSGLWMLVGTPLPEEFRLSTPEHALCTGTRHEILNSNESNALEVLEV